VLVIALIPVLRAGLRGPPAPCRGLGLGTPVAPRPLLMSRIGCRCTTDDHNIGPHRDVGAVV